MFIQKRSVTASLLPDLSDLPGVPNLPGMGGDQKQPANSAEDVDTASVEVDAEATDLLFEAEDVAELLAEVTDQVVEVSVDGDDVIFSVGDDEFTVTPEGDEELLEASTKVMKRPVTSRRKIAQKRPVQSSVAPDPKPGKSLRKIRK